MAVNELAEVKEWLENREADEQDAVTLRIAAEIATGIQQGIDELVEGKIVVTRDELHQVGLPKGLLAAGTLSLLQIP
jgi:hypothetical protein